MQAQDQFGEANKTLNDLATGRLLQRSLLPQSLPSYPGLDIAAEVWTAVDLGGDYYQFLEQPSTLAVAIADSSGKSVAGAIHAALFKGQLDAYGQQGRLRNPSAVLSSLNQLLCKNQTGDAVALSYGALDLVSYDLFIGSAGIPGPILFRANTNTCEEILNPSIALGRLEEINYTSLKRTLDVGDIAVFFSDGLFEACNSAGQDFGRQDQGESSPLQRAIIMLAALSAKEIVHGLKQALDVFTGSTIPEDDVSIVVIKLAEKTQITELRNCPYQEALEAWVRSDETDESALLRGSRLSSAVSWAQKQSSLPRLDLDFLEASQRIQEKEQLIAARASDADRLEHMSHELEKSLEAERRQRLVAEMGEINEKIVALTISSEALYLSNNYIEAMIAGVIGGVQLKRLTTQVDDIALENLRANTQIRSITALEQVVYGIHEYNRLEGHGFWVNKVCYSPNGQFLASASSDRTVRVWSVNGSLIQVLSGHNNWVTSVAFSPNGQYLVSGSRDNTIKLWQWHEAEGKFGEEPIETFKGHEGPVLDVCFSPDGEHIASASEDTTARIWKLNGTTIKTLRGGHDRWITCISYHPQGHSVITGSADRSLIIWNMQGVKLRTLRGHDSFVEGVCYAPNGLVIASVSRDRTVKLWGSDGVLLKTFYGHTEKAWGVAFSSDNRTIASAGWDRTIRVWDIEHGLIQTFQGHGDVVHSVAFHPDGRTLASASRDTTVKLWNIRGTTLRVVPGHTDEIQSLAISGDGRFLVSTGKEKTVFLWHSNGTLAGSFEGHNDRVNAAAFSADNQSFVTVSADCSIRLWRLDGTCIDSISGHRAEVHHVSYRCDGQVFATCSADTTVRVWSAEGKWLQTLSGHLSEVYAVCFSPDGSMLASASKDKMVNLWSWDGTLLRVLDGHSAEVYAVCFSPDGTMIASAGMDQSVKIWSIEGTLLKTLNGHSAEVRTVLFSPNGKILISAGDDKRIIMWNLDLENLLMRGCQWLQEYLRTNINVSEEDKRTCLGGCAWLYKYLKGG